MPLPTARSSSSSNGRRWFSPAAVHCVSLVVALAWILVCGRGQWFFFDEWDFLKLSSTDLLTPHLGHWSTAPMLVTAGLRELVGLGSYWPYLLTAVLVHLGIAHVLWRLLRRAGVSPWIAVLLAFVVALFGAGAENILWAFQFGFLGAVLLNLVAVLLVDRASRERYWRGYAPVVALTVLSLTFSGTALPLIGAVAIVALRRVGLWRTALLIAPSAAVYLAWYLHARSNPVYFMPPGPTGYSVITLVREMGGFAFRMLVGGLDGLTPVPFLGPVLFLAIAVYATVRAPRLWTRAPLVLALAAAAIAFALLTAYSRFYFAADTAASSRYIYLTTVLLIPLIGLLCTELASLHRGVEPAIAAALALTAVYGGHLLLQAGEAQAVVEQGTRAKIYAVVDELAVHDVDISSRPDPVYAPSLTVGDLRALVAAGAFSTDQLHPSPTNGGQK